MPSTIALQRAEREAKAKAAAAKKKTTKAKAKKEETKYCLHLLNHLC